MISRGIVFGVVLVIASCHSALKEGSSRLELVDKLSDRTINVQKELEQELLGITRGLPGVLEQRSADVLLVELKAKDSLSVISVRKLDLADRRNYSYDLWRHKNFVATLLVYKSAVKDVNSGNLAPTTAVEIEHEGFTGTLYVFYPAKDVGTPQPSTITYVERN